jgi:TolA-binding protein
MKSTLMICCALALAALWACNTTPDPELELITALENEVNAGASAEKIQELVDAYEKYVADHPGEVETNAQFLHKAAFLQFSNHRYASAAKLLKDAIRNFYESGKTPDNALFLASLYHNQMGNELVGNAAYAAFLEAFPKHPKVAFVRDSVLLAQLDIHQEIDSLRARIYNDGANRYDSNVANDFIAICEVHGLFLPADPRSPDMLYEAARTAGYIRSFPKAVELYEWVYKHYPDYDKSSQALFMMAFTYDNEMRNVERAKSLYEEFLQKYPNDDFADDAQMLLQNLGKSEDEVLQELQKK